MKHIAGGKKKEEYILTPGGHKGSRRPDITMRHKNGTIYRENVGKQSAGRPILRERKALEDLEKATGQPLGFTPYN